MGLLNVLEKIKSQEIVPMLPDEENYGCPKLMCVLLKQMVSFDPLERPSAKQIVVSLEDNKMKNQIDVITKRLIN